MDKKRAGHPFFTNRKKYSNLAAKSVDSHSDINELKQLVEENRLTLIEQEHRFISAWVNFFKSRKGPPKEKTAALHAVIVRFLPGRFLLLATGGAFIGLLTIALMERNNQIMVQQNYEIRRQIYIQQKTDRAEQLTKIKDYLYKSKEGPYPSINKSKLRFTLKEESPFYNRNIRQEAFNQYKSITETPLTEPVNSSQQSIINSILSSATSPLPSAVEGNDTQPLSRVKVDLPGAHLRGLDMYSLDLQNANLQEANLYKALLIRTNLRGADLQEADLQGANLSGANFQGADLSGANFQGAVALVVNLQGANLQGAGLRWAYLPGANLQGADLQGANLQGADLQEANLQEADLRGAILAGANLLWAFLQGANLQGANFQGADLSGAYLQGADLQKVNLQGAGLQGAYLQGADLQGAGLQGAGLQGANLQEANLSGANLGQAKMANIRSFNATKIFDADFTDTLHISCSTIKSNPYWYTARLNEECYKTE